MGYLPEFHESSIPAVRLLQGAVYSDDTKAWELLLTNRTRLQTYFARVGLILVIDEADGFAYLRQLEDEEIPDGWDRLPKLMRRSRLGYDLTLFSVLLRDELRRFDEQNVDSERCILDLDEMFVRLKELLPDGEDEVRMRRKFDQLLTRAQELGFLRKLPAEPPVYEIRPILKARLTAERMEQLKEQLLAYSTTEVSEDSDG